MSGLGNIVKKELKELMTIQTFLPIILVAIIFASMGNGIQGAVNQASNKPTIGLINEDTNGTLAMMASTTLNSNAHIIYNGTSITDKEAGITAVKQAKGAALVIIPSNFTTNILHNTTGQIQVYWIMNGFGILDTIPSGSVEALQAVIDKQISSTLISSNNTVNASIVLSPTQPVQTTLYKDREFTGLSPGVIINMLSSQSMLIPIVMMMIIIMAGSIVIMSMAMEKENKTLETLLTLPVKRTSIVTGKIIAAAVIGLILATIYMIGMSFYLGSMTGQGGINLASYGLTLGTQDFLIIGISLFITLIAGLALCMLLGTFAKNYKSAQTLTFPITMLALIPMFLTMFTDFNTLPPALQALTFAIPFSAPMMAPRALMFHDYTLVAAGIIYVTIFAVITISLAVWVFKTDRILTGSSSKWAKLLTTRRRRF